MSLQVDENRVAILHFPYSDPATVPTLLPPDVRAKPYNMPEGMNGFLCQLLDVKKRELCRCLPMPIVQPQVRTLLYHVKVCLFYSMRSRDTSYNCNAY